MTLTGQAVHLPLRAALIGAGNVVLTKHTEAYAALSGRLRPWVVCDPSAATLKEAGDRFGIPLERRFSSLDELARVADEIDLAVVATPQRHHQQAVKRAVEMGWHVLCEKPLAMSVAEADAMVAHARQARVKLGVVHNFYYMNCTGDCQKVIHDGVIGDVRFVRCETHIGSEFYASGGWRTDKSVAGRGHFLHCLYHEVYLIRDAIGSTVKSVSARTANLGLPGIGVEDTFVCDIAFENGAIAVMQDVGAFPRAGGAISVFEYLGTKGSILRNIPMPAAFPRGAVWREGRSTAVAVASGTSTCGMTGVFDAFVAAIERNEPLPYNVDAGGDGLDTLRVVYAAYESADTGRRIEISHTHGQGPDD